AVGRRVAGDEVRAARVDDVEAAQRVEADLEEVAEREVTARRDLDRIDKAVVNGAAEHVLGPGVDVPVAVEGRVGEVADADGVTVRGDVHPAVANESAVAWRDVLLLPGRSVVGRPVEVEGGTRLH